jgi:transposase
MLQLYSKKAETKKPHITPEERVQILLSLQNGYTTRQIAKAKNISPSTVSCINKRWHEQHSLKNAAKPGQPPTINEPIKKKLSTSLPQEGAPLLQKFKNI